MKTVLVATDFSQASANALEYALRLADGLNTGVALFSCYEYISPPVSEVPVLMTMEELRDRTLLKLTETVNHIEHNDRARVDVYCKPGFAAEAILEISRELNAELIITGTKKSAKGLRRLLGSTVTELARKTQIPMIVVPEEVRFNGVNSIALANEGDLTQDSDKNTLAILRKIAEHFQSRLFIVRVAEDDLNQACELVNQPTELINTIGELDPAFKCVAGTSIPEALNAFIDYYKIDLLALLPHKHSLLERLFFKSTTRAMVFETSIPLLIMPDSRITLTSHTTQHWEQIIL